MSLPRILLSFVASLSLAAAPASAAVSCAFNAGAKTLTVTATAAGDTSALYRSGVTGIGVADGNDVPVACSGGTPSTVTLDTITYNDASSGGTELVVNAAHGSFGPGATGEGAGNVSEIEITANMAGGDDTLQVDSSGAGADVRAGLLAAGKIGINLNTDENVQDGDDISATGIENVAIVGGAGPDVISGQGGAGAGSPLDATTTLMLSGGDGLDALTGGNGADQLGGDGGNDTIHGMAGDDQIDGGAAGDDLLDGGAGVNDRASWHSSDVGVHVDAGLSGPQDTAAGNDTLVSIELIEGSTHDDVLRAGPTGGNLDGGPGDDLLVGSPEGDALVGGQGVDTVDYSEAGGPITFELTTDDGTGPASGAGDDEIYGMENVIGSPYADVLKGNGNANRIDGGGGADTIEGRGGDDTLLLRDGMGDTADCGDGTDTVTGDAPGVDALSNCENLDLLPGPADPVGAPQPVGEPQPVVGDPQPVGGPVPAKGCVKALRFRTRLDRRLRTATARLAGKRLRVRRVRGRLLVRVDLRKRQPGVYRLKVVGRTASGRRLARTRRYRVCG